MKTKLTLTTVMVRKPFDKKQIEDDTRMLLGRFGAVPEEVEIDAIVNLSKKNFEAFQDNLLADRDWLAKRKAGEFILVKERGSRNETGIIVNTAGFGYARYSGLPMTETEFKHCPNCGQNYIGHPAISRKDNKTEICPKCGRAEALKQAGFSENFINKVENLVETAGEYKIKIEVSVPEYNNGKKTTHKITIEPKDHDTVELKTRRR